MSASSSVLSAPPAAPGPDPLAVMADRTSALMQRVLQLLHLADGPSLLYNAAARQARNAQEQAMLAANQRDVDEFMTADEAEYDRNEDWYDSKQRHRMMVRLEELLGRGTKARDVIDARSKFVLLRGLGPIKFDRPPSHAHPQTQYEYNSHRAQRDYDSTLGELEEAGNHRKPRRFKMESVAMVCDEDMAKTIHAVVDLATKKAGLSSVIDTHQHRMAQSGIEEEEEEQEAEQDEEESEATTEVHQQPNSQQLATTSTSLTVVHSAGASSSSSQ